MITYHPNGGDLGRAELRPITALELKVVIPHVANILADLSHLDISDLPFKYAFEVHLNDRVGAELVIASARLPQNVFWYETDGHKLFEIRGQSGGITTSLICYLVTKDRRE